MIPSSLPKTNLSVLSVIALTTMKLVFLLASICTGLTGVSSQGTTNTDEKSFYNLWCDPAHEDECYFVDESCNPETDTEFNCEYHPALFVEDDVDPGVHESIVQLYYIWCEPSDNDECYFINEPCDPENDLETCEYHPAIFTESDLQQQMEQEMMSMSGDGRNLRSRSRHGHRHHRYRRYKHGNRHRYRRHIRHHRYYGGY